MADLEKLYVKKENPYSFLTISGKLENPFMINYEKMS